MRKALARMKAILASRLQPEPPREARERRPEFGALGASYEAGWTDERCLFVLSTGRAGTQTLARVLGVSRHVEAYHEPTPTLAAVSAQAYEAAGLQITRPAEWDRLLDAGRAEFVAMASQAGRIYVETNNRMSFLAPTIARFFPGSRFVFLHRHPFEVIHSGMNRGWYDSNSWDWCRIRPRPGDPYHPQWSGMDRVERIAWLWAATNAFILEALEPLESHRWMELRSADLFSDGTAAANAVLELIGLPGVEERATRPLLRKKLNADDPPTVAIPRSATLIVAPVAERLGYRV